MRSMFKPLLAGGLGLVALIVPAFAQDLSPEGRWKSATGESRYQVSLCGDGTALCARLTWLRDDARTEQNLALLNDYVVSNAKMTGENQWKGTFRFDGQSGTGKLTMTSSNSMTLSGCKLGLCKEFKFVRI